MDSIQGALHFDVASDGTAELSVDQTPLATIGRPEGTDTQRNTPIYLPDGKRWMVDSIVPSLLAAALEADPPPATSAVSPFGIPVWPAKVESDSGMLAEGETGVSPMTFSPVVATIRSGDAEYTLTAGQSWGSWTLSQGEGPIARIDTTEGIFARIDQSVPTPVVVLTAAIVLGVAAELRRPGFATAKRREGRAREKFLKKYRANIDAARAASHEVQYMASWDQQNDLYSWIECLTCGRSASTFGDLGGSMKSAFFFGKAMGDLKGPMLDGPCPGHRTI